MDHQTVIDRSDLRKWRIELPNLYDDADLDPYEFRLLAHYKRVGTCTEGLATTARKCHMSVGQASEKRRSLADKGWIQMTEVSTPRGPGFQIEVVDVWEDNFAHYSTRRRNTPSPSEASPHQVKAPLTTRNDASPGEIYPSPGETKNQPVKNQPIQNLGADAPASVWNLLEPKAPIIPGTQRARAAAALTRNQARQGHAAADLTWLSEQSRPLAQAFIDAAGIVPARAEQSYWRKSLNTQCEIGLTPAQVAAAVTRMRAEGLTIKDPGSVTAIARDLAASAQNVAVSPRILAAQAKTAHYRGAND